MTSYAELDAKLNGKLVEIANKVYPQIILITQNGLPVTPITDFQVTQIRVWLGMAVREAAAAGIRHADERRYALPPPPPPTVMVTPQALPGPDPRFDEDATTKPMKR